MEREEFRGSVAAELSRRDFLGRTSALGAAALVASALPMAERLMAGVARVLGADREAADDLRRIALAPLDQLRPNTAERLAETLRSWLLHRGQRDAVAADLFVHAQTVRYRMTQLRELFGDRLNDPATVLELIVALSIPRAITCGAMRRTAW